MVTIDKTVDSVARERCLDLAGGGGEADLIFLDGFDTAIVGVGFRAANEPVVVYDRQLCLDILDGLGCSDPEEYFVYNVLSAYVGSGTPVFVAWLDKPA